VKIQANLKHENIVPVIDHNLETNQPEFVMPRAIFNLKDFLKKYGASEKNLWIIYQISEGLKFAHSNGIIHRDLKPENVLFLYNHFIDKYYFAICDFGLGRDMQSQSPVLTKSGIMLGTYEYMAPEQYRNPRDATQASDIYSLGKLLFEIITGEIPYPDIDLTKIPQKYTYIIQKACNNKPDSRYQNIDDLLKDLNRVTNETTLFLKPEEVIGEEIERIIKSGDYSQEKIERIIILFTEHQDDMKMLFQRFPKLPNSILKEIIKNYRGAFLNLLKIYDQAVSGGLEFGYCDTVADFYKRLYLLTDSFEIRQIILNRLPRLGYLNNRYHVGGVFALLISQINDPSLILSVKETLESDREMAKWNQEYLERYSLPIAIKEVFSKGP
jgi:serine/threonine protein kinase